MTLEGFARASVCMRVSVPIFPLQVLVVDNQLSPGQIKSYYLLWV